MCIVHHALDTNWIKRNHLFGVAYGRHNNGFFSQIVHLRKSWWPISCSGNSWTQWTTIKKRDIYEFSFTRNEPMWHYLSRNILSVISGEPKHFVMFFCCIQNKQSKNNNSFTIICYALLHSQTQSEFIHSHGWLILPLLFFRFAVYSIFVLHIRITRIECICRGRGSHSEMKRTCINWEEKQPQQKWNLFARFACNHHQDNGNRMACTVSYESNNLRTENFALSWNNIARRNK